jgi:hypothetical protein
LIPALFTHTEEYLRLRAYALSDLLGKTAFDYPLASRIVITDGRENKRIFTRIYDKVLVAM